MNLGRNSIERAVCKWYNILEEWRSISRKQNCYVFSSGF